MREKEAKRFVGKKIKAIRKTVGKDRALVALSGGVDSSAVAALAHRAIGNQLISVFVDDGLMRENEGVWVRNLFKRFGIVVKIVDAREEFLKALSLRSFVRVIPKEVKPYVEDPEEKREVIEECFYKKVFPRICEEFNIKYWLQGTILTDIEELQAGIKLHHNVRAGLDSQKYGLPPVIEPLVTLRKSDVRVVAKMLGLPEEIYNRMAFPGPGLAVRVLGEVTPERVEILKKATPIVEGKILKAGYRPFQAFPVLHTDKATGIKDGKRIFGNIISIRCVESKDALTAEPTRIDRAVLEEIRDEIYAQIPSVVKVTYDISTKPPSTIEWE